MACEYMLWLDLETTGLDINEDHICEVAAILTDAALTELFSASWVVKLNDKGWLKLIGDRFVREMHADSGLLKAMLDATLPIARVDEELSKLIYRNLEEAVPSGASDFSFSHPLRGKVRIAGSGVSHFDLHFVRRLMPYSAKWLDWRPMDIGQIEEWRLLLGLTTFDEAHPDQAERKTHRAADDIAYHLDEARWYLDQMQLVLR